MNNPKSQLIAIFFAVISASLITEHAFAEQTSAEKIMANQAVSNTNNDLEIIHVLGQRNTPLTNTLQDNNNRYFDLSETNKVNTNIGQWLAEIPGISLNGQGGLFQSYSIRGFSKWRIQTLVDGIPLYTDRRAGNSASFLPELLVNGVDVTQGPSSTLYGSDAMGGVINLKTLDFNQQLLSASWQNQGDQQELLTTFGEQHWQSAFAIRQSNDSKDADGNLLDTSFKQYALLQKNKGQWRGINLSMSWLTSYGKNIGKSSALFPEQRITLYPNDFHNLWQLEASRNDIWYGRIYHHYQNWDTNITRVGTRQTLTEYQAHSIGASLLTSHQLFSGDARLGVDWHNRQGVSISESEFSLTGQQNYQKQLLDAQQHNLGLFADINWQFKTFAISSGIRQDLIRLRQFIDQQQRSESHTSANIAAHFQVTDKINSQLELATGFRFPSLTELYFEGETPRGTTLGNNLLKPEQSQGVQWSIVAQPSSDMNIKLTSYYYQLDDYIERFTQTDGSRSYRNLDTVTLLGAEFSGSWQQSAHVSHRFSYQWQQGEDQHNQAIADLLPAVARWQLDWQRQHWLVSNTFALSFRQHSVAQSEQVVPTWLNWQLSVTKTLSDQLDMTIWGNNLLARNVAATADEDAANIIGRTLGVKLNYHF